MKKGISTGIHYPVPFPMLPCYKNQQNKSSDFFNSINDSKKILSLPIYPELEEPKIRYISNQIKIFFSH